DGCHHQGGELVVGQRAGSRRLGDGGADPLVGALAEVAPDAGGPGGDGLGGGLLGPRAEGRRQVADDGRGGQDGRGEELEPARSPAVWAGAAEEVVHGASGAAHRPTSGGVDARGPGAGRRVPAWRTPSAPAGGEAARVACRDSRVASGRDGGRRPGPRCGSVVGVGVVVTCSPPGTTCTAAGARTGARRRGPGGPGPAGARAVPGARARGPTRSA